MNIFDAFKISASGLSAERLRMDVISANIANANSTRSAAGGPYRRQVSILGEAGNEQSFKWHLDKSQQVPEMKGVRVLAIKEDPTPFKLVYEPQHPDANEEGYVAYPNVDTVKEMVEMITASRAYEANITALNSTKSMLMKTLEIGRG